MGRCDVGDIGVGGGIAGAEHAGQNAADQQQPEMRGKAHHRVVEREAGQRGKQNPLAAEPVGQTADNRREDELHAGIAGGQPSAQHHGIVGFQPGHILDQGRHDRHDQPDADHVDQHGDENEDEGVLAGLAGGHDVSCGRRTP
jgi:hypothetical protein